MGPGRALLRQHDGLSLLVSLEVGALAVGGEELPDVVDRLLHFDGVLCDVGFRPRQQDHAVVVALLGHEIHEHLLVGENVALIAEDVVQLPQVVVQEARRTRDGEHPTRFDVLDVAQRAVQLALPLELAECRLGVGRKVIDHRVPDRAGELQQVRVYMAEFGERGQLRRTRVVLVEQAHAVGVLDPDRRVTQWAVRGRRHRLDHHLGAAVEFDDLLVGQPPQIGEPQVTQFRLHVPGREVGVQDHRVLADVLCQVLRVEVVAMQVGHVEVVALAEPLPVQPGVVGEREPRREERRIHPRVAQDRPRLLCLDEHARVSGASDPHSRVPFQATIPGKHYFTQCRVPWAKGP